MIAVTHPIVHGPTSLALKLITLKATELFLVHCFVLLTRTLIRGRLNGESELSVPWGWVACRMLMSEGSPQGRSSEHIQGPPRQVSL
jgi:hypothetical protein